MAAFSNLYFLLLTSAPNNGLDLCMTIIGCHGNGLIQEFDKTEQPG
jgi:hypothetical protein